MKKKEKKKLNNKKPLVIVLIIIGLLLLASPVIIYAAYTNTNSTKLVVAKYGNIGFLFSSNRLKIGTTETSYIFVDQLEENESAQDIEGNVTISNFAQENQAYFYERVINYAFSAKLVYNNNGTYTDVTAANAASIVGTSWISYKLNNGTVVKLGYDNGSYVVSGSFNSTLPGRQFSTDNVTLTFSADQVSELMNPTGKQHLFIELTATPTPAQSYKDLREISGRVCLALTSQETLISWEGYFSDESAARDVKATDTPATSVTLALDGYNYIIDGFGSATITLRWNSNYLELNEGFILDTLGLNALPTANGAGWKQIQFTPTDITHYELQFYKSGTQSADKYDTWNELVSYVTFSYTS